MDVRFRIDPAAEGVTVTVTAPAETDELKALRSLLSPYTPIHGWRGEKVVPLTRRGWPGSTPRTRGSLPRPGTGRPTP